MHFFYKNYKNMMLLFDQKLTLVIVIICILMIIVISQFVEMCHLMVKLVKKIHYHLSCSY